MCHLGGGDWLLSESDTSILNPSPILVESVNQSDCNFQVELFETLDSSEYFTSAFFIDKEAVVPNFDCGLDCVHYLDGCRLQLKPCAFFKEAYCRPSGIDPNAEFIFNGVLHGFDILDDVTPSSYCCDNYSSIMDDEFKSQMDANVIYELSRDKVSVVDHIPRCVHALGAVRKSSGKLRPITDCKRPLGFSIYNHMETTCQEFSYTHIDEVTDTLIPESFMAVLDIKAAYRSVNINPNHKEFQGFQWPLNGTATYFTDNCLCFGLRCAPWIFTQLTEFIIRGMKARGFASCFGYLDDFLVMGQTYSECNRALNVLSEFLSFLGFELALEKVVKPSQSVKYLGLLIDSVKMELSLPPDKLKKLYDLVLRFSSENKTRATKHELDSLCGVIAHASKVVRGGRTFSRRLINLSSSISGKHDVIALPDWFKADLQWWLSFCQVFNGKAPIIDTRILIPYPVETDSSLSGFGCIWNDDYVVGSWSDHSLIHADIDIPWDHWAQGPVFVKENPDINLLELWPILVSVWRWGRAWTGCKVRFKSDNTQVVRMLNTGRSRSIHCMAWLRELFWLCFLHDIHITSEYISTHDNIVPDYLSRVTDPKAIGLKPPNLFFFRTGGLTSQMPVLSESLDG